MMRRLENFVSAKEYARLCGVPVSTIFHRVKNKNVSAITVNKYHFIDIEKSPPQKRVNYYKKSEVQPASVPADINLKDLVSVKKYARRKRMRCDTIFERIILGKLATVIIGDSIFVNRKEILPSE